MTRRSRARVRRDRRQAAGQAVLELAFVLPILLALIFNFLAVMVLVQIRARVIAAATLGAQAATTAQVGDVENSCIFASSTFFQTALSTSSSSPIYSGCPTTSGGASFATTSIQATGGLKLSPLICVGNDPTARAGPANYFSGSGYPITAPATAPPVVCTVTASFDFANTPLGFAVPWSISMKTDARAYPSHLRQCATGGCP